MRFCLIAVLLLATAALGAEEPVAPDVVTPESVTAGGKTLAEWRKMAGVGAPAESDSVLFVQQTLNKQAPVTTLDACRASLVAQQEVILHNLVNLRTVAYKRLLPILTEAKDPKTGQLLGSRIVELRTDFSQGPLVKTGRPLDLAIDGPGFFVLQEPKSDHKLLFTRRGQFSLDKNGTLGLQCGEKFYPLDPKVTVTKPSDFFLIDQVKVRNFTDHSSLTRSKEGFFELPEEVSQKKSPNSKSGKICQGMLEFSNVDKTAELQEWDMTFKLLKDIEPHKATH